MNSIKGKSAELKHLLHTMTPDIMLVCESKLDKTVKHSEFLPANYTGHIRNERTINGGGVLIVHKKELVIDEIELEIDKPKVPHHDEIIWARLTIKDASPVYIGSYYRPTSSYAEDSITALQSSIEYINASLIKDNTLAIVILGGDFNVPEINWETNTVIPGSTMKSLSESLLGTLE